MPILPYSVNLDDPLVHPMNCGEAILKDLCPSAISGITPNDSGNYVICDPRPGREESNPSFSITQGVPLLFVRFGGDQGNAVNFVADMKECSTAEAMAYLQSRAREGGPSPSIPVRPRAGSRMGPLPQDELNAALADCIPMEEGLAAHDELKRRGLGHSTALLTYMLVTRNGSATPGALVFAITGPDGQVWNLKARNLPEPDGTNRQNRYTTLTMGHGSPAWCNPGYGQGNQVLIVEGELNAAVCYEAALLIGIDSLDAQGLASATGKPHIEGLRNKRVLISTDEDAPGIKARERLKHIALEAGASGVAVLAPFAGGDACDIAGRNGLAGLGQQLLERIAAAQPSTSEPFPLRFVERANSFIEITSKGERRISNFTALITAINVQRSVQPNDLDRRIYTVAARLSDGRERHITVDETEFARMDWVATLGPSAIIEAGNGNRDRLRQAIQEASVVAGAPKESETLAGVGRFEIDGRTLMVSSGVTVDEHGVCPEVKTVLPSELKLYEFPPPADLMSREIEPVLKLREIAEGHITAALFASMVIAPFGNTPYTVLLQGETGTGKSTVTALFMGLYGSRFDYNRAPASFVSTRNALLDIATSAANLPVWIDDFVQSGATFQQRHEQEETLNAVIRGQGNSAARQRSGRDGRVLNQRKRQGLLIVTGEQPPSTNSIRARMLELKMSRHSLYWDKLGDLTAARASGALGRPMTTYLIWCLRNFDRAQRVRADTLAELRLSFTSGHRRSLDTVGDLLAGARLFSQFLAESGAKSHSLAEDFLSAMKTDLLQDFVTSLRAHGDAPSTYSPQCGHRPSRILERIRLASRRAWGRVTSRPAALVAARTVCRNSIVNITSVT